MTPSAATPHHLAVIANPAKFDDLSEVRSLVAEACERHGWPEPLWYETTVDDPGPGQARQAVRDGATLVCPLGGDGTVRAVASVLVDEDVPMGLLPGGTGNLLARNLDLPVDDLGASLDVALGGVDRRIDVGTLSCDGGDEEVFLVMAGAGLDAEAMEGADDRIKNTVGWPAYVLSAARALRGAGFRVTVETGAAQPVRSIARAVVVGNCGTLTGGMELMPDALVDDGVLDTVVVAPRGLVGWFSVLTDVLARRDHRHSRLERRTSPTVEIRVARPVATEMDGEVIGRHRDLRCGLRPLALTVRVPAA